MGFDVGIVHKNLNLISYQKLHNQLGHPGDKTLLITSKENGMNIDDFQLEKCESCALAKCRRTNLMKSNTDPAKKPGERVYLDTSWTNMKSGGNSVYWFLLVDEFTKYSWSTFGNKKSDLSDKVFPIILSIFNTGHKVYKLRLDNAGENWELEDKCLKHILGIKFEYTTPNTPQHNGVVERKFQSLYNKLRATLFESGLTIELCNTLWAECASTVTTLENICVGNNCTKSPHELFYHSKPRIINKLRIFGEIGVVKNYMKSPNYTEKKIQ